MDAPNPDRPAALMRDGLRRCAQAQTPQPAPACAEGERRFRDLLGVDEWAALPERTRRRFARKVAGGESMLFRGVTTYLHLSLLGRILCEAARVIGAPLPLDARSEARPAIVAVTEHPSGAGQIWTRVYARSSGFPQTVNSVKTFSGPTGLEEHVGGGVSMSLALSVEQGALIFRSVDYFLSLCGVRLRVPRLLAPGAMVIGHHDLGERKFAFTLTLTHPRLGVLIDQTTLFTDMEEARDD